MSTNDDLIIRGRQYAGGLETVKTVEVPTGIDPNSHTHSKIVASDGAPDPALSADANGYINFAVHPYFSAYLGTTVNNVTGDGTSYTIIYDTEVDDRGGDFNIATGIFTAPVDGKYLFIYNCTLTGLGVAHTQAQHQLVTSNRNYRHVYTNPVAAGAATLFPFPISVTADMDALDTVYTTAIVYNGAKTVDIFGNVAPGTFFMGYLLTT